MNKTRVILYFLIVIFLAIFNFYLRPVEGNIYITEDFKKSPKYINNLYKSDEYFKEQLLEKDQYYVYEEMIEASLNNKITVEMECKAKKCDGAILSSYYALYLDHPELISFVGITTYHDRGNTIGYTNFGNLDQLRYTLGVRRIEREIDIVKKETKNMSEKEKIIYVYDYVASHDYDRMFTYMRDNQSAYSFFSGTNTVCAAFAKASQLLFQNIGIKSYLVLSTDHMWNYVEYEGKYYVFDATMGASLSNKKDYRFYDGLGRTTIDSAVGLYKELYPEIETKKTLKEIFDL